jgi:signal peptidase I
MSFVRRRLMTSISKRGLSAGLGIFLFLITTACVVFAATFGKPLLVTTHGISMEPRFHTGDLAVLLPADSYHVGDVVAYRSSALKTVVMHRIVKIDNGHYTFKGDNNSWLDPAPATRGELLGKLALRVPQGGVMLPKVRSLAPFALAGIVLLAGTGFAREQRGRTRNGRSRSARRRNADVRNSTAGRPSFAALRAFSLAGRASPDLTAATAITAVVAVFGVFLGIVGLTASSAATDATPPAAATSGAATSGAAPSGAAASAAPTIVRTEFSYSARVGQTPAYDQATVRAPAPIFRKVTNLVDLSTAYTGPPGTFTLTADLSTQAGWHSTIELSPATAFTEAGITRTVQLDLNALDARAQAAAAATGLPANMMGIDITATVTPATGDAFISVLHLTMNPLELSMVGPPSGLVHETTLAPTKAATASTHRGSGAVNLLGRRIPADLAIALSVIVLAACALSGTVVVLRTRRSGRLGESDAIRHRYSDLLVPTEPVDTPAGRPVVDVPDMATLAKIAERYGLLVLNWSVAGAETYAVQDESTTYRYRPAGSVSAAPAASVEHIAIDTDVTTITNTPAPETDSRDERVDSGVRRVTKAVQRITIAPGLS